MTSFRHFSEAWGGAVLFKKGCSLLCFEHWFAGGSFKNAALGSVFEQTGVWRSVKFLGKRVRDA